MRSLRRLGFALWLAVALVAGQHLALLHDFGHAADQLGHKQDSKPSPKCDKHFASTQLVGAAAAGLTAPLVACEAVAIAFLEAAALAARPPAYRSRAPPALL
jgi:HD superfamily phosphodiesterase